MKNSRVIITSGVAVMLLLLFVLSFIPSRSATTPTPSTVSNTTSAARVSVTVCPTTYGARNTEPSQLPSQITMQLTAGLAGHVAAYTDGLGIEFVLAPRGWGCAATVGADGTSQVTVTPTGASSVPNYLSSGDATQAVVASQTSVCAGCLYDQACPLFSSVANANVYTCPAPSGYKGESATPVSAPAVEFADGPGVRGSGSPSGGANVAMGLVTYAPSVPNSASYLETCTLAPRYQTLCSVSLLNFYKLYEKL